MPDSCCAIGCAARRSKSSEIRFYRIPGKKDKRRRTLWLNAIRRDKWTDSQIANTRLCSKHLISGRLIYSAHFQSRVANGHLCTLIQ